MCYQWRWTVCIPPREEEYLEIGRLHEKDLAALAELYRQFRDERSSLEKMRATFRRLEGNPNYYFLAARLEGRLFGSLMGVVCEELYGECRPFMVVDDVIVDSGQRRRGIGAALMGEIERIAVGLGCGHILLVTDAQRSAARRFYESLGYEPDAYCGFKKYLIQVS